MEKSPLQTPNKAYETGNTYPASKNYEDAYTSSYEEEVGGYDESSWGYDSSEYVEGQGKAGGSAGGVEGGYGDFDADLPAWEEDEAGVTQAQLDEIKRTIQASDLSWEEKKPLLEKIQKAAAALDLGQSDEAFGLFEEVQMDFEGNSEEKEAEAKDKKAAFVEKLKGLEEELKKSNLSEAKKDRLRDKIKSVDLRSSIEGLSLEKLDEELDGISKEIGKEKVRGEVAGWFKGFSARVPQDDHATQYTVLLANKLQKALESGSREDWDALLRDLSSVGKDGGKGILKSHPAALKMAAIQQLVGTMFYSLAGMDETKLEQMLDAIPKDVRRAMIGACRNADFADDLYHCDGDTEKQQYGYYGTGRVVAGRLEQSLTKDDLTPAEPATGTAV
ncbi:MAG: hypothetical protein IT572_09545 [Deltaproteobacteria bacterium]|nr:hypothetical protein [Deltaproteobacteria bacterium]